MKAVKIIYFLAGCLFGLLVLELVYQALEIKLPYHELSPSTGKKMNPGKRVNYFEDGFYLGEINRYGYLGPAFSPEKDSGKIRIAILGDSYAEGFQLFEQYHFSRILSDRLNKASGSRDYEVLNFGIGNYNWNDMLILYKNFASEFEADRLVFVLEAKDFLFRENFIPSPVLQWKDDSLVIDYSFTESRVFKIYDTFSFFFENSAIIKSLNNAYKISKRDEFREILFDKFYNPGKKNIATQQESLQLYPDNLDHRIPESFNWIRDKEVYFVFKDPIPEALLNPMNDFGISSVSVRPVLDEQLYGKGIIYNYWDVSGATGHWNHHAQPLIAEIILNLMEDHE